MMTRQLLLAFFSLVTTSIILAPPPPADEMASSVDGDMMDAMDSVDKSDDEANTQETETSDSVESGSEPQSGTEVIEKNEPEPSSSNASVVAPETESSSAPPPSNSQEPADGAGDDPLFAPADPKSTVPSRKEMFAQTESSESASRELMKAIDEIKSRKMNEYIALDKELDEHAKEVGLARGKAADSINDIKDALWQQIEALVPGGADDASQKQISDHKAQVEQLEQATAALSEQEAVVITALKELSSSVSTALDAGASVAAKRTQLKGVIDDGAAQKLFDEIKAIPDQLKTTKEGLTAGDGVVTKLDDAMKSAREQAAKVKELVASLKALNLDVSKTIQTFAGDVAPAPKVAETDTVTAGESEENASESTTVDAAEEALVAVEQEEGSKKKTRRRPTGIEKWVKGTWAEGVYYWLADGVGALWHLVKPVGVTVRGWMSRGANTVQNVAQKHLPAVASQPTPDATPSVADTGGDPVLSQIRKEREEAAQKAAALAEQHQTLAQKEEMLNRLEAERIAALDTQQDIARELGRSVTPREMSWRELGYRFIRKLYVSVARGVQRLYQWWSGTYDPLATQQKDKKSDITPTEEVTPAPVSVELQQKPVMQPEPVAESVIVKKAEPVPVLQPEPVVPSPAQQSQQVAQEVAAVAAEVAVDTTESTVAQKAVETALATAEQQVVQAKNKVKKAHKDVAFVNLGK